MRYLQYEWIYGLPIRGLLCTVGDSSLNLSGMYFYFLVLLVQLVQINVYLNARIRAFPIQYSRGRTLSKSMTLSFICASLPNYVYFFVCLDKNLV